MTEFLQALVLYLAIGAATGVVAGRRGIGGGLIIVPALAWIFHLHHLPENLIMDQRAHLRRNIRFRPTGKPPAGSIT